MPERSPRRVEPIGLREEDLFRAQVYALIGNLFLARPTYSRLERLASLQCGRGDSPLHRAWKSLATSAANTPALHVREEFDALFVSLGVPPILPYGSFYASGVAAGWPLDMLRHDLSRLCLERMNASTEAEDHLGALCEAMALLVAGPPAVRQTFEGQRRFFERHIGTWYLRCLDDIRLLPQARFYREVANLCEAFFMLEEQSFEPMSA